MLGKMDYAGLTDQGLVRETNEDSFLLANLSKSLRVLHSSLSFDDLSQLHGESQGFVLAVADGMGGHSAGERASQLAIDAIIRFLLDDLPWNWVSGVESEEVLSALRRSVLAARDTIAADVAISPQHAGMGTTLTLALIDWPHAYLIHVGDTRCYLCRGGNLQQLTHDHTVAQLREDLRTGAASDRQKERFGSVNWEAVGSSEALWNVISAEVETIEADAMRIELEIGDSLLLCSDGLSRLVDHPTMQRLVAADGDCESICRSLIDAANAAGGGDNITTVLLRFLPATSRAAKRMATESLDDTLDFEIEGLSELLESPASIEEGILAKP